MTTLADLDVTIDGAALLDEVHAALIRYVILPSPEAADAVTLVIAATHAQTAWEHAPRLVVKSPLKRCGKTRLLEFCRELVHRALPTSNTSVAAVARSISEEDPPTLIHDEADTVFGKKDQRQEGAEDLRGIYNSGHSRGWPYARWNANANRREEYASFAMLIIAGIGDMPDTIEDRGIVISMRRRAPGERVTQWRTRRTVPALRALRARLHGWVVSVMGELEAAEPELPAEDRAADTWEPLVAIADTAGGSWPERARQACKAFTGAADQDDPDTVGERLLLDLHAVFGPAAKLPTAVILERLEGIEEAPWGTWHRGGALSPRGLAALLKPWRIRSRDVRTAAGMVKGYYRLDMVDAWSRYIRVNASGGASPQVDPDADGDADAADASASAQNGRSDAPSGTADAADAADAGRRSDRATCQVCGEPIDPAAGDIHPSCEPRPGPTAADVLWNDRNLWDR